MGLRKHGEGEIIPDTEQQKQAAKEAGMSEQAYQELREESERADSE